MDSGNILVRGSRGVDWKVQVARSIVEYMARVYERSVRLARGNAARAFDAGVCDNARRKLIIFHGERGPETPSYNWLAFACGLYTY